jgi:hypothetical protein
MTRTTLLAIACVVVGSTSALAPAFTTAARTVSATATFLVPEQGRQLVAFSRDYHLSEKAKESAAGRASSNLAPSNRRRRWVRVADSSSSPRRGAAGVASAARDLAMRLLGHSDGQGGTPRGRFVCEARASLEEELMNAYPKDPVRHPEDEAIFRRIVN